MEKPIHAITRDLLVLVRAYLGKMPFDEVAGMITELEKCPTVNVSNAKAQENDPGAVPSIQ